MQIEYLADHMNFTEQAVEWIYSEFFHGIRHGISYEQLLQSFSICHKTELPIRLVAIENERCVGTVSIVQNDLDCRDYTPWLAALYVDESHRGNKIGEELIERVKQITKELGYDELYLRTEYASNYYRRLGWQFIESCDDHHNLKPDVFKVIL